MKKLIYAITLPVVLFLAACSPSNPLIGKWESEPIMGMSSQVEFTGSSMINSGALGNSEIEVDDYLVEEGKVGVVIAQQGQKVTSYFRIVDADTIEQDMGMMKVRFHRKK